MLTILLCTTCLVVVSQDGPSEVVSRMKRFSRVDGAETTVQLTSILMIA
jgi:hypothetical protein